MKKALSVLVVVVFAAVVATNVAAQGQKTIAEVGAAESVTVKATVTAIAPDTRVLLLKGEGGKVVSLQVPAEVKNFPQIKVGDIVVARYVEAIAFELKKPGESGAKASVTEEMAKAAPGEKPAGIIASQVKVTVVIQAIDMKKPSVTVQGPEGNLYDLKVKDPKKLEGLKVGDRVEIIYTQALAISVEAAPKAPASK
jgi:Cu/Ag efflux protein CusF